MIDADKTGPDLFRAIKALFVLLISQDRAFIYLALIYGLAISILTLSVPVSVQMLINSVMHTASVTAISILAGILLMLLMISGTLIALQTYIMELFERRFYARITAEFTMRNIHADYRQSANLNRYELVNRYFDIMHVQNIIPSLVIGFFAIVLQMLVGVILVSFYHPWLFIFCVGFVLLLYFIWRVWGYRAFRTAIDLSAAKYATAQHLEDVARANDFFKSRQSSQYAIARSDSLTQHYIKQRIRHFRNTFSQKICLLILYALSSAGLLGLGGLLVIHNELTLGQLVAAELVLSSVFFGISRLDNYLVQLYTLGAALEEISRVFYLPQENNDGKLEMPARPATIHFDHVGYHTGIDHPEMLTFNMQIAPGQKLMAATSHHTIQETMIQAFKCYTRPRQGELRLGEYNILDYHTQELRNAIVVLDRPTVVECSIAQFLRMLSRDATLTDLHRALALVELQERVEALEDGMETLLTPIGKPLSSSETLRLKLACAWLAKPHLLVVNELFDSISYHRRHRIFTKLCEEADMSLLYFSSRQDLHCFDQYMYLDIAQQYAFDSVEALREFEPA